MRVLINGLSMAGARTGIGHYTAELYRSLVQIAGPDEIGCFPAPVVRQARVAWTVARSWWERALPAHPAQGNAPTQRSAGRRMPGRLRSRRAPTRSATPLTAGR